MSKTAGDLLIEAAQIVEGTRQNTHGAKERSFAAIGRVWTAYIEARRASGPITARNVSQMMELLKIIRSVQGDAVDDHFVDAAGYAGIAGELAAMEREPLPHVANSACQVGG